MTNTSISSLPQVKFCERASLPSVSAVYIVLTESLDALYVGQAKNLKTRWVNHHRVFDCIQNGAQSIAWIECSELDMSKLEQQTMLDTRPLLNGVPTLEKKVALRDCFRLKTEETTDWFVNGISAQESLALVSLLLKVKKGGIVYASQTQLANIVQCSRPTLSKGINGLVEKGLVSVVGRAKYQISPQVGNKLA
jgi:Helix-turn-helix domain